MRYNTYPALHIRGINVFTTRAHASPPIADYGEAAKCSELPTRETPSYGRSETREEAVAKKRKKVSESEKEEGGRGRKEGERGERERERGGGRGWGTKYTATEKSPKAVLCVTRRARVAPVMRGKIERTREKAGEEDRGMKGGEKEMVRKRTRRGCEAIRNTPGIFERVRQSLRRRPDGCTIGARWTFSSNCFISSEEACFCLFLLD
ncbi:hypothetical protein ALC56_05685 [Trachymyrmex septentrionalis]|uniref:Uncharacterized protein n=1 Tax=Trachymyrmex septentrionalis TaxID=34720 RepID=A0A195FI23_9HYME|nr:hypothetical protein ALC56_05685 [Trachymyrmex septentrionalis]